MALALSLALMPDWLSLFCLLLPNPAPFRSTWSTLILFTDGEADDCSGYIVRIEPPCMAEVFAALVLDGDTGDMLCLDCCFFCLAARRARRA